MGKLSTQRYVRSLFITFALKKEINRGERHFQCESPDSVIFLAVLVNDNDKIEKLVRRELPSKLMKCV